MKHEVLAQKVAAPGGRIMLVSSCAFYLALSAYASATEADASESEPLLDEIVAGSEANFELIDHGRASYEEIVNLDGEHSHTQQFTIQFDYPVLRADMPDRIVIYKPDYVIRYFTRMGPQPEYPPREHRVVIVDPAIASPPPVHPRAQYPSPRLPHAGSILTGVRRDPNGTINTQHRVDGHIEVRYENRGAHIRAIFVVAPQFGYSLTRIEEFALKSSDSIPFRELMMSYRRIPSGAYIVEERHELHRLWHGDEYSHTTETLTRLVDFDPARPSPDVFRLESIGLPEGARIDDQINQRRYIFGVTAVTEDDIGVVEVTGPWRGRAPRRVLLIGTLVIGLVVLWFGVIRPRFPR